MIDIQDSIVRDPSTSSVLKDARYGGTTLPSELCFEYNKKSREGEGIDHESLIQNILSSLAVQRDLVDVWEWEHAKGDLSHWISASLQSSTEKDEEGMPVTEDCEPGTIVYEWWVGMQLIATLLPNLSAFEIHNVAMQSIVFAEGSQSHWILCTILCSLALKKCPSPLEKQWRRWQSLICETIRHFQSHDMEQRWSTVPLWTDHVLPACKHVLSQLPSEALRVAILSGLVGTASTIVVEECHRTVNIQHDEFHFRILQLVAAVRNVAQQAEQDSEQWVFSNPWRSQQKFDCAEDEDVIFEKYKEDIAWWSTTASRHEKVAGMDTNWSETGVAILAVMAFDSRPLTLTPTFIWRTWFPHVTILFKAAHSQPFLEELPFILLEHLFKVVPETSLPTVSSTSNDVDAPYEAFQLLSNRMMAKPIKNYGKKSMKQVELDSKTRSEFIVGYMKCLLNRYQVVNQVKIVRKLTHDCPHPGLKAKFLDLLRPVIFEEECSEPFWSYLGSFLKNLQGYVQEGKDELVNTKELINDVEVYVGTITMVQLWCLVKGKLPKKIKGAPLGKFHHVLKKSIDSWMDEGNMPPDDYYRLYLLEGALQQLILTLDAAKEERQQEETGFSSSARENMANPVEGSLDSSTEDRTKNVIVGDADIFS